MNNPTPQQPTNPPPPADALTRARALERLVGEEVSRMIAAGEIKPIQGADVLAAMRRMVLAVAK